MTPSPVTSPPVSTSPFDLADPLEDPFAVACRRSPARRRSPRQQDRQRRAARPSARTPRRTRPTRYRRRRCAARRCSSALRTRRRSRRASPPVPAGASSHTMAGVAFPSSSFTRLRCARSAIPQPTSPEPVNVISFTRSSSTSTSPICGGSSRRRRSASPAAGPPPPRARRGRAPRAVSSSPA